MVGPAASVLVLALGPSNRCPNIQISLSANAPQPPEISGTIPVVTSLSGPHRDRNREPLRPRCFPEHVQHTSPSQPGPGKGIQLHLPVMPPASACLAPAAGRGHSPYGGGRGLAPSGSTKLRQNLSTSCLAADSAEHADPTNPSLNFVSGNAFLPFGLPLFSR